MTIEDPVEAPVRTTTGGDRACRVFVGNVPWKVTWQDLKDHMRSAGGNVVRADVFSDVTGRSRGCGIVAFETPEQAQEAIAKLTDTELGGRKIFVREDREDSSDENGVLSPASRGRRSRGAPRATYGRGGVSYARGATRDYPSYPTGGTTRAGSTDEDTHDCQVFVGNLTWKTTWQDLKDFFRVCGEVLRADVYERDGRSRGCGTVLFKTPEEALAAIEKFNEAELDGRQIIVRLDRGPPRSRK